MSNNPNKISNGGSGTFGGKLIRGILSLGKSVSPQLKTLIEAFDGTPKGEQSIATQLSKDGFDNNELQFLLKQLDRDIAQDVETTKRWDTDMKSDSWLSKNVRPATLWLYNISIITIIILDSSLVGFTVKTMWLTILIANSGMINTAYFGSRYLEKRDDKKYK
tara:strand:- start:12136 stop:12624 length:489 start_codon:yes stop_codon:yes gene_type:complete